MTKQKLDVKQLPTLNSDGKKLSICFRCGGSTKYFQGEEVSKEGKVLTHRLAKKPRGGKVKVWHEKKCTGCTGGYVIGRA